MTLEGANGYSVTGQGILDFCCTFPSVFDSGTTRRTLLGQTSFQASPALELSGGVRIENEDGFTQSTSRSVSERTNGGAYVEARASVNRVYANGGFGVDHNAVFGTAVTPRVSAAAYLRSPSSTAAFGDTKDVQRRQWNQGADPQELSSRSRPQSPLMAPRQIPGVSTRNAAVDVGWNRASGDAPVRAALQQRLPT